MDMHINFHEVRSPGLDHFTAQRKHQRQHLTLPLKHRNYAPIICETALYDIPILLRFVVVWSEVVVFLPCPPKNYKQNIVWTRGDSISSHCSRDSDKKQSVETSDLHRKNLQFLILRKRYHSAAAIIGRVGWLPPNRASLSFLIFGKKEKFSIV